MTRPRRSALYMPGSNARALEKGRNLAADCLILDLEDAVAPEAKSKGREQVVAALGQGGYGRRELVVRINALDGDWGMQDLAALAACPPDAVLVPKVGSAAAVGAASARLDEAGFPGTVGLWAMIETPAAILNAGEIAEASARTRLAVLVMGTNDLAKETMARLVPGRAPMAAWLSGCVIAARAHRLAVLDGVHNGIGDAEGFRRECEQGRDFGFDGKTLIHPDQIPACNDIFAPDAEEIAFARTVVATFEQPENRDKGVVRIGGRMVERLHEEMARRTVALAEAIAALDG